MSSQTIYLYSVVFERSLRFAATQHGAAGFFLFLTGLEQLQDPDDLHGFLAWLAVLTGAVVLIAAVIELRNLRKHRHTSFGWVDLFSVPVLIVEGMHKLHLGKRYLPFVYFFLAIVMLARGLVYYRLLHLRKMTLDDAGLFARVSPFRKLHLQWQEIDTLECNGASIDIVTKNGAAHAINLDKIRNKEEAQQQVLAFYHKIKLPQTEASLEHSS